ncbi:MAG: DUF2335 domain-containing protein [Bacteroidetes bacterium]|nr:MAG: DUF2335 domain-containing protein [Bacteroidota bacterium]
MHNKQNRKKDTATTEKGVVQLSQTTTTITAKTIPDAEELEKYNKVDPSFADRIMKMAEKEQSHRHQTQTEIVQVTSKSNYRGQIAAILLSFGCLFAAVFTAYIGSNIVAVAIAITTTIGLASSFLNNKKKEN